jgi:hypothetical protein
MKPHEDGNYSDNEMFGPHTEQGISTIVKYKQFRGVTYITAIDQKNSVIVLNLRYN